MNYKSPRWPGVLVEQRMNVGDAVVFIDDGKVPDYAQVWYVDSIRNFGATISYRPEATTQTLDFEMFEVHTRPLVNGLIVEWEQFNKPTTDSSFSLTSEIRENLKEGTILRQFSSNKLTNDVFIMYENQGKVAMLKNKRTGHTYGVAYTTLATDYLPLNKSMILVQWSEYFEMLDQKNVIAKWLDLGTVLRHRDGVIQANWTVTQIEEDLVYVSNMYDNHLVCTFDKIEQQYRPVVDGKLIEWSKWIADRKNRTVSNPVGETPKESTEQQDYLRHLHARMSLMEKQLSDIQKTQPAAVSERKLVGFSQSDVYIGAMCGQRGRGYEYVIADIYITTNGIVRLELFKREDFHLPANNIDVDVSEFVENWCVSD